MAIIINKNEKNVYEQVNENYENIKLLDKELEDTNTTVSGVVESISKLNNDFITLDTKISTYESKFTEYDNNFHLVNINLETLNNKVSNNTDNISQLTSKVENNIINITSLRVNKQNTLKAGNGINIDGNTISVSNSSGAVYKNVFEIKATSGTTLPYYCFYVTYTSKQLSVNSTMTFANLFDNYIKCFTTFITNETIFTVQNSNYLIYYNVLLKENGNITGSNLTVTIKNSDKME